MSAADTGPRLAAWLTGRRILWIALGVALVVRLAVSLFISAAYFDEIFQYLEPAYHLTGGPWVIPWDQRSGIRSWFLPLLLSAPMGLGRLMRDDPAVYVTATRMAMCLLSLLVVAAAVRLGLRLSRWHALFAGTVSATWFELVYFAPRTLSESAALSFFMGAVLLIYGSPKPRFGHWAGAGLLLGLSFLTRFQYAPAIGVVAIGAARLNWKNAWTPLCLGGAAAIAIGVCADVGAGQPPLYWLVKNVTMNVVEDRSTLYGTQPFWAYGAFQAYNWLIAALPIGVLFLFGARRYPVLAATAIVHLAAHSLIAHKEYRFGLVAVALIIILAAIGTGDVLDRVSRQRPRHRIGVAMLAAWVVVSAALAVSPTYRYRWTTFGSLETLTTAAGREPAACGLAVFAGPILSTAYVFYNRPAPIYVFNGADAPAELSRHRAAYNAVIAFNDSGPMLQGFSRRSCRQSSFGGDRCLFVRPGPCASPPPPPPDYEINARLRRSGE